MKLILKIINIAKVTKQNKCFYIGYKIMHENKKNEQNVII